MSHDYHQGLPGYHPDQLFHDGCYECEQRASRFEIDHLDIREAWMRAYYFERGSRGRPVDFGPVSVAEAHILRTLWKIQVQFERVGIPLGLFPGDLVQAIGGLMSGVVEQLTTGELRVVGPIGPIKQMPTQEEENQAREEKS
jgi:hypothetical protein